MSFSWDFNSFDLKDFENKILKGQGVYTADEEVDDIDTNIKEQLLTAEYDYNKLSKKYWAYLDQYFINSIIALPTTKQVSPDHAHWSIWSELGKLNNAEPNEIFNALSSDGRRYNIINQTKSIFSKLKSIYEGITGKNRPDYIIIKDDELRIFIKSLTEIFESANNKDLFEAYGEKEELKPYFLEPFVLANEKGKAILGILI